VEGITLFNGKSDLGGAVRNRGHYRSVNVHYSNNQAVGDPGEAGLRGSVCGPAGLQAGGGGGGGAPGMGGAIAGLPNSTTVIEETKPNGCVFSQNKAEGGRGGAIEAMLTVENQPIRCGGRGGGSFGGQGGVLQIDTSNLIHGEDGIFLGGGGGGSPTITYLTAGSGGDGAFGGGGGGGGASLMGFEDGLSGDGGFGAGDGAARPFTDVIGGGGGGGGGAGLGGAIAILNGEIALTGCMFANNLARGGRGGQPRSSDPADDGFDGATYGRDLFTMTRRAHRIENQGIQWQSCFDIADFNSSECTITR
jgi:hypothetical protein